MSWASKANNQWQTVGDVSGAITAGTLTAIGSAPSGKSSSQYITYAEFIAWVQTASGLAATARWVTKNAVNPYIVNLPYSFTVYSLDPHATPECYGSKADACTHTPAYSRTVYSSTSSISAGAVLYFFISGVYVPVNYSTNSGANLWLYDATGSQPFLMTDDGGVTSDTVYDVDTCATPYYYYDANYWADCSGVTTYGVVVRSTVALTLAWSRWGTTTGANYLNILGVSGSTSYTYESDDTQNTYCGY